MKRFLLLALFVGLMADVVFGWGLGLAPGVSLKNAILYLLVLIFGTEVALAGKFPEINLPKIHAWFALLIFVATLSFMANIFVGMYVEVSPFRALISLKGEVIDYYLFFLVFFIGAKAQTEVLWLQKWVLIVIAIGSIATVMDTYDLPDLGLMNVSNTGRVVGPLGESNQYGLFVAVFLPILIARTMRERGAWWLFFAVAAVANFWVLLLTISRGAVASLVVGSLISMVVFWRHLEWRYVKRALAIGLVVAFGLALLIGDEFVQLLTERFVGAAKFGDTYDLTSGRTWIWQTAIDAMSREPWTFLTGYGLLTFGSVIGIAPHNSYLGVFFELGVLGVVAFVMLLVTVLRYAQLAANVPGVGNASRASSIAIFTSMVILSVGIFALDLSNPWYFIWSYVGLAMRESFNVLRSPALDLSGVHDSDRQSRSVAPNTYQTLRGRARFKHPI